MTYRITSPIVGGQAIADTDTVQRHPLGLVVDATDEVYGQGKFIYLKGVASTVRGSAISYNQDDWTSQLLTNADKGPVAVAMSANVASQFGWYQIFGKAIIKAATVVDNADVYSTATAGTVDDTVVAGDRVKNAKFASADGTPSAGLAECEINYPWADDGAAA